eukprot:scaffold6213_cov186-Alexandrium_tamarense.AAC.5
MSEDNTTQEGGGGNYFVVRPSETAHLTASGNDVSNTDDDQPVLMEAKLGDMIKSLCQLIRSNQQLDEALREAYDEDLLQALRENDLIIKRKLVEVKVLQHKLHKHGVQVSIDDKVPPYTGSQVLQTFEKQNEEGGDGLYL